MHHHLSPATTVAVLVEGESDRVALTALAERLDLDLSTSGAQIVVLGGVTNTRAIARGVVQGSPGVGLAGLYDSPDVDKVRCGLAGAGLVAAPAAKNLRDLGFFGCTDDLEDELIRAVGLDVVEEVIASEGEAHSLRLLSGMPAQRTWSREAVVRRFLTSRAGRKARYAQRLVEAMDLDRAPDPLAELLRYLHPG